MKLSALLPGVSSLPDLAVEGVTADSRAVKPGFVFVAIPGIKQDGRRFVGDAVAKGAVAVIGDSLTATVVPDGVVYLPHDNPRLALAQVAAQLHAGQPPVIAAVTGTNGKTSIADFARQIWARLGQKAASVGTLGVIAPGGRIHLGHTTPDATDLHRILATLSAEGVTHLAFEASSHGLAQFRLDAVRIAAAGFTNLTRDHMDFHPTFEDYKAAKLRLFTQVLPRGGLAVVNSDGAEAAHFAAAARAMRHQLVTVGKSGADLTLTRQIPHLRGQALSVRHAGRLFEFDLPLTGGFQAGNALVAAAFAIGLGAQPDAVFGALSGLKGAPGRLEFAGESARGAAVFIDYAHTPDALETILVALRGHCQARLHVVFGCGGDRDAGKRPLMGSAAARLADVAIITDDNPRSEDPALIRAAIRVGAPQAREIGDRRLAIQTAVAALEAGDILVIAGKGHEQGQIIGTETRPFDDLSEAREAIKVHGGHA